MQMCPFASLLTNPQVCSQRSHDLLDTCQIGFRKHTRKVLKIHFPNIIEKGVCDDANAIHGWNRFLTTLGKENWYRNHCSLLNNHREFFKEFFSLS